MDLYRKFTAADVSGVYFSGLPVLPDSTTPAQPVTPVTAVPPVPTAQPITTVPPILPVSPVVPSTPTVPPVPPQCWPMPAFTYSDDNSSVGFGHQPNSYVAYNISGQETLLANQYVRLSFYILFTFRTMQFLPRNARSARAVLLS